MKQGDAGCVGWKCVEKKMRFPTGCLSVRLLNILLKYHFS